MKADSHHPSIHIDGAMWLRKGHRFELWWNGIQTPASFTLCHKSQVVTQTFGDLALMHHCRDTALNSLEMMTLAWIKHESKALSMKKATMARGMDLTNNKYETVDLEDDNIDNRYRMLEME